MIEIQSDLRISSESTSLLQDAEPSGYLTTPATPKKGQPKSSRVTAPPTANGQLPGTARGSPMALSIFPSISSVASVLAHLPQTSFLRLYAEIFGVAVALLPELAGFARPGAVFGKAGCDMGDSFEYLESLENSDI